MLFMSTAIYQWLRLHLRKLDVVVKSFTKLFIQMQLHWLTVLELKSLILELQATNSIDQIHAPAANASQYYQRTLTIPMLDHLITELDNRFEEGTAGIIGAGISTNSAF